MPWGLCGESANHLLECPPQKSMPMCDSHWKQSQYLEKMLQADPNLTKSFEKAVNAAYAKEHGRKFN